MKMLFGWNRPPASICILNVLINIVLGPESLYFRVSPSHLGVRFN